MVSSLIWLTTHNIASQPGSFSSVIYHQKQLSLQNDDYELKHTYCVLIPPKTDM